MSAMNAANSGSSILFTGIPANASLPYSTYNLSIGLNGSTVSFSP